MTKFWNSLNWREIATTIAKFQPGVLERKFSLLSIVLCKNGKEIGFEYWMRLSFVYFPLTWPWSVYLFVPKQYILPPVIYCSTKRILDKNVMLIRTKHLVFMAFSMLDKMLRWKWLQLGLCIIGWLCSWYFDFCYLKGKVW